ncbi:MAG: hypothetical protein RL662_463 [Bacteroidota bacterium]|jgi:hypothetical protein
MSEKHILVQNGLVYCSQSVGNNSPATGIPINVTSQTLVDANGGKLVATEKDDAVANMNFGLCNDPKYKTPPPCMAKVVWSKMYEAAQIEEMELHILTEESEAICNVCSVPGKIKIAYHGQQATVVPETMTEAQPEIMEQINPLSEPIITKREEIMVRSIDNDFGTVSSAQIKNSEIR